MDDQSGVQIFRFGRVSIWTWLVRQVAKSEDLDSNAKSEDLDSNAKSEDLDSNAGGQRGGYKFGLITQIQGLPLEN